MTSAARLIRLLETPAQIDFPVLGCVLYALGAWALFQSTAPPDVAVRLLVLAERFAYTGYSPSLDPARTSGPAEELAPGAADRLRAELGTRRGPDLLEEARAAVDLLGSYILRP